MIIHNTTLTGLYIHVPFCQKKCSYCSFYSFSEHTDDMYAQYLQCLFRDFDISQKWIENGKYTCDTIYFGGGTPSILPIKILEKIMIGLTQYHSPKEVTLEANPKTITVDKIRAYQDMGISRISLGIQSLDNNLLRYLGRIHDSQDAMQSLQWVASNFHHFSVDIMYAIPNIPLSILQKTIHTVLEICPHLPHISTYPLTIEENTPFAQMGIVCNEEQFAEEYIWLHEYLTQLGYEHYEVSNFCLPGYRSVHNSKYWTRMPYIGFGAGSHSLWEGRRFSFKDWQDFANNDIQKRYETGDILSPEDEKMEIIMLGLRTKEGIPISTISSTKHRWQRLQEHGYIEIVGENLRATLPGWMVLNQIILTILD